MLNLILRRLTVAIPTLLILVILSFVLMYTAPGGPFTSERPLPAQVLANIEAKYGLDQPFWKQIVNYVTGVVTQFDFGPSFQYKDRSVNDIIAQGFPVTLTYGLWSGLVAVLVGVPLGIAAQWLNEYNLHRYVFHLNPPSRQWAFDLLYRAHYGHHDFPTNHKLFFVPVWVALPMLGGNFLVLWALMALLGVPQAVWIAVAIVPAGGVLMFLAYEWFHMSAHLTVPKSRITRHVTRLHNQHHFRDFSKWFHVSPGGQIIDRAMGTDIDHDALKAQQRIEFIRTLGMSPDDPRLLAARARFAGKYGLTQAEIARAGVV